MRNSLFIIILVLFILVSCKGKKVAAHTGSEAGELVYKKYCLACHQDNGSGVPGMYPPLIKTSWVQGDKTRLIGILLNGLEGKIEVNGQVYHTAMPPHQYLTDQQIADVLTYVRISYGNEADAVLPEEVASARNQSQPTN